MNIDNSCPFILCNNIFTMKEKCYYIVYLLWFSYLVISAVVMFGHGFLLSRKTLNDVTGCIPVDELGCDEHQNPNISLGCNNVEKINRILFNPDSPIVCAPERKRVVLILVDALRYDFTEFKPAIEKPSYYQNKLPIIRDLVEKWPKRTRIFKFMADPPTTTLQRIKALVTGSLPTFVDISSNFAAMEIQEDNVIDQIVKGKSPAILLGDDTWARLMPGRWHRSHAMYSFHTWDLDTVDTEIDSKIYQELKSDDWELLVAHYLGIDHAGHRYGPNHPEMARKLGELNSRLEKIVNSLPSDTILYVIGDHGMTETGDHGGESKAERTAALFAYYRDGFQGDATEMLGAAIQQTSLAATVSAALGRPPPAPSLGSVILPVLPVMSIPYTLLHLTNNLKQVTKYLLRYGEESQQVPLETLAQLINSTRDQTNKAATIQKEEELKKYIANVGELMDNIRGVFREVWVEFDSLLMLRALLLLSTAVFFNWIITEGIPIERIPSIFGSSFVPSKLISVAVCITICYTAYFLQLINDIEYAVFISTGMVSGAFSCVLVILNFIGFTNYWYDSRPHRFEYFARWGLYASALALFSNSFIIEEGAALCFLVLSILFVMAWDIANPKSLVVWAAFAFCLALTRPYRGCREEQGDCWTGDGKSAANTSRHALVLALGSMAAVVSVVRRHLDWRGHGVTIAGVLVCAHWAVGWGSLGCPSRSKMLARGAWVVIFCTLCFVLKRDCKGPIMPLVVTCLLVFMANTLVLGTAYAPVAALALLAGFLALNMISMIKTDGAKKISLSSRYSLSLPCFWALLASYFFYASGHHATLGHVSWAAVFHAGDPAYIPYGNYVSAALMFLNLFGMPFMFGVAVPLLALWNQNGASTYGPRALMSTVFLLCLRFSLCFAVRVFATALAATIHCRHLMIWGVFTPKLLFEFGACIAALLGSLAGAALTARHHTPQHRAS